MFRLTRAGRGGDSTRGPAFTVSSEAHRQERIRGAHRRARGRLAGAAVAAVAVVLLGSACGQYAYAHRDQTTPVAQVTAPSTDPQQPATPATTSSPGTADRSAGATGKTRIPRADDGKTGPKGADIRGGTKTVDLSKRFRSGSNVGVRRTGKDSKGGSTTNTRDSRRDNTRTGKGTGTKRGDGAHPGAGDIQGQVPGPLPTGSLDLAQLISQETEQGAKYNSTILPEGFPFTICPVMGQYSYSDDYGAPRYAGGYHPHAGNDIFADIGTPIVAPFAGYVEKDGNTLGGNAVKVTGAQGYVYMAHLVAYGITDQNVKAGDVVGFVGNTGDAQGTSPHDHFEWHPNAVASYDRQLAGTNGAVDPFPYLQVVCPPD